MTGRTQHAKQPTRRRSTHAGRVRGNAGLPDLTDWPRHWMGMPADLGPGRQIVACFQPFLEYLAQQHLSQKTFRRHVNNLWLLGGEIIRSLNLTPSERTVPLERLVFDAVQAGGPLLYHSNSAEELRSFESTCRRFERFLATAGRSPD